MESMRCQLGEVRERLLAIQRALDAATSGSDIPSPATSDKNPM
jgi:hypothetical protein